MKEKRDPPTLGAHLLQAAYDAKTATTAFSVHEALWRIRCLLVEEPMQVVLGIDALLARSERQLDPATYEYFRKLDYLFPEDFDNVPQLLKLKEPNDGNDGLL